MRRIKKLRVNLDLTQRAVAREAGIDPSYICKAETLGCPMYPRQAEKVAKVLGWKGDLAALYEEI